MAMRFLLVEGDPLVGMTGVILPTGRDSPSLLEFPVAFIGDQVQCFICGDIKPIEKDGGSYRVGIFSGEVDLSLGDIFSASEEFAYENDVIYCSCGKKPLQALLAPVKQCKDEEDPVTVAQISNGAHMVLAGLGMVPVFGTVADVIDLGLTAAEYATGNATKADLSLAGVGVVSNIIPGADQATGVAKMAKAAEKMAEIGKGSEKLTEGAKDVERVASNEARREVMRQEGIPISQQPISQSKNDSGREYRYEVAKEGGGTEIKSVQQQTMDSSHVGQGHWEAGSVKTDPITGDIRMNDYGRPKLINDKSKVDYDD